MSGIQWALLAALCNATIGVASGFAFKNGADFSMVAFYKCVGALIVLAVWKMIRREQWKFSVQDFWQGAILAFFGVFCLYYFETAAFKLAPIPIVSFTVYASGVACLLLSWLFLKEQLGWRKIGAIFIILMGIVLIEHVELSYSRGVYFALLGGLGYSLYLFLLKLFERQANTDLLLLIFFFGSIFLYFPWHAKGSAILTFNVLPSMVWLVFVPTIFGFYCTNRAIASAPAGLVQIVETSDPVFASLLGFVLLGHSITNTALLGCMLVFLGLILVASSTKHE